MSKKQFDEFIEKHSSTKKEEITVNWDEIKNSWLKSIDKFYELIDVLVEPYIESKTISSEYKEHTIHEEKLGSYKVKKLLFTLGDQEVNFTPIGTVLLGAKGRIDMEGISGKVKFILTDKKAKGITIKVHENKSQDNNDSKEELEWKISTPPPNIQYFDINEESFFDALLEVVNV